MNNPWLRRDSFIGRVNLPDAIRIEDFDPTVTMLMEDQLPALLGGKLSILEAWLESNPYGKVDASIDPTPGDVLMKTLYDRVVAFMVYTCWAMFSLEGSAQATPSGFVAKKGDDYDAVSDRKGAEIYKEYKGRAETQAQRIRELLTPTTCGPVTGGNLLGSTFSSSRGRTTSKFDS